MDGECQPGFPIFEAKTSNLIGIHQGFSKMMMSSDAIEILEQ
jgi:hypothetical protein